MAYQFSGIFARAGQEILAAVLAEHGGYGRTFSSPFEGFGVTFIGEHDFCRPTVPEELSLIGWSAKYPEVTFVYLWVQCDPGASRQSGFVFRNGRVIHREVEAYDGEGDDGPLRRLMRVIDVHLPGPYFEPLVRGFFARPKQIGRT